MIASLSEQYAGRLRLFAARRIHDRAAAEDLVQEALRIILEALRANRVRDRAALAAFAFETVRNLCLHHGRSQGRETRALGTLALSTPDRAPDVLSAVIARERRGVVRAALDRLSPDDRRMLAMTYGDGRGAEEIGRELGLTAGAVRVRRHRAVKRLTELLGVTIGADREQD